MVTGRKLALFVHVLFLMVYTRERSRFVPLKIFGRESGEMFRLVLKNSGKEKERDPRSLRGPSVSGSDDFDQCDQAQDPHHHTDAAEVVADFILVHVILLGDSWDPGVSGVPSDHSVT